MIENKAPRNNIINTTRTPGDHKFDLKTREDQVKYCTVSVLPVKYSKDICTIRQGCD